jgi:hypothetical protein
MMKSCSANDHSHSVEWLRYVNRLITVKVSASFLSIGVSTVGDGGSGPPDFRTGGSGGSV